VEDPRALSPLPVSLHEYSSNYQEGRGICGKAICQPLLDLRTSAPELRPRGAYTSIHNESPRQYGDDLSSELVHLPGRIRRMRNRMRRRLKRREESRDRGVYKEKGRKCVTGGIEPDGTRQDNCNAAAQHDRLMAYLREPSSRGSQFATGPFFFLI